MVQNLLNAFDIANVFPITERKRTENGLGDCGHLTFFSARLVNRRNDWVTK